MTSAPFAREVMRVWLAAGALAVLVLAANGCAHAHSEDLLTIRGNDLCWTNERGEEVCLTALPTAEPLVCYQHDGFLMCGLVDQFDYKPTRPPVSP